jgi:small basic protein (TIGR04137 family)
MDRGAVRMKETTGRDTWRFGKTAALLFVNGRPIVTSMTVARSSVSMLAHPVLQRPGAAALPSALPRRNRLCVGSAGSVFTLFSNGFAFIVPPLSSGRRHNRPGVTLYSRSHMSQHRSLKGASTIAAKRNVLKRFERVELLKKRGQFKRGDKVIGLPKTKPEA